MKIRLIHLASLGFIADAVTTWWLFGGPYSEVNPISRWMFSTIGLTFALIVMTGVRVGAAYSVIPAERWLQARINLTLNRAVWLGVLVVLCVIGWSMAINNVLLVRL